MGQATAKARGVAPEQAIIAEVEAFSQAWSRGDANAAASFYTEDGIRVGAAGDIQHGRGELEAAYARLFQGPFRGARVTQEAGSVRMLGPNLALWQGGLRIDPPGGPPILGYSVQLMERHGDRWLVAEGHPKLYPPAR